MTEEKRRPGRPATGRTPLLNVRVSQEVQNAARDAAERRGEKFAVVVTRLLADYASLTSDRTGFRNQDMPAGLADELRRLRIERSWEFPDAVRSALDAGWTLSAIARAVGLTRQAIHYQARRAAARR